MNSNNAFIISAFVITVLVSASLIFVQGVPTGRVGSGQQKISLTKPQKVIAWSNGFPSGEHYNLNIHGKKPDFNCDSTPGGGSVFVPEYGDSLIQIIQNKKSKLTGLYVIDPCSTSPHDPAKVQLQSGEYQVYARILAKPSHPHKEEERKVVLYPRLIDACDDTGEANFSDFTECNDSTFLGIGKITKDGAFDRESAELIRIAPAKGKNKAQEITDMFQWSGYVCDAVYDTDGDGQITLNDVTDMDGDLDIDNDDFIWYLETYCQYFEHEWIFNIADLVVYGWDYNNMGSKLVQVRFYPKESTDYV